MRTEQHEAKREHEEDMQCLRDTHSSLEQVLLVSCPMHVLSLDLYYLSRFIAYDPRCILQAIPRQ